MTSATRTARSQTAPRRFPPPGPDEIAWIVDAVMLAEDEGIRTLLDRGPNEAVVDLVRLASTATGILAHLGQASFATVTAEQLQPYALTEEQGRAWDRFPDLLPLLRVTVRGQSKGLRFVVCAGCHRWMLAKDVPKAKACPLTSDCTGPQVGVPAGIVTSTAPGQVEAS